MLELAKSPAAAVMVDLEDLWLERRPKNVPGIGPEGFPSWRRKFARDLGSIVRSRSYAALVRELVAGRAASEAPKNAGGAAPRGRGSRPVKRGRAGVRR
jgi:4-alpha-glucanotransferase